MSSERPNGFEALPVFGRLVDRPRLSHALAQMGDEILVISAPGGYGKSVLAAQIAQERGVQQALWIDASCVGSTSESILRAVSSACRFRGSGNTESSLLIPHLAEQEIAAELRDWLKPAFGERTCIVLDDLRELDTQSLAKALALIRSCGVDLVQLIVTTRSDVPAVDAGGWGVGVVTAESLRLTDDEVDSFLAEYSFRGWSDQERRYLLRSSARLPALLSVMVRRASIGSADSDGGGPPSGDILDYLRALAIEQLDQPELRVLCAMALMRHGTVEQVVLVSSSSTSSTVERVSRVIPLVHLGGEAHSVIRFRLHDLAAAAFSDSSFLSLTLGDTVAPLAHEICASLDEAGRFEDVILVSAACLPPSELADWVESRGRTVLLAGSMRLLSEVLESLGPALMLKHPRLLLLHAELLREKYAFGDALTKAAVARDIALLEGSKSWCDALLLMARMQIDLGHMGEAADSLTQLIGAGHTTLSNENAVLAEAYLGLCLACTGDWASAREHTGRSIRRLGAGVEQPELRARVLTCVAVTTGVMLGRWSEVLDVFLDLRSTTGLSAALRLQCQGNLACVLSEMGRLDRASELVEQVLRECRAMGLDMLELSYRDSLAAVKAGMGLYSEADELADCAIGELEATQDNMLIARLLVAQSAWTRAEGSFEKSLLLAERALEYASTVDCEWLAWLAMLETAASLMALGDASSAVQCASRVRGQAAQVGAQRQWLLADLILAEAARRDGRMEEARVRLLEHEAYIMGGSANWVLAMYTRAFPHIVALLCDVFSVESIPTHLVRMILPRDQQRVLRACSDGPFRVDVRALRSRLPNGPTDASQTPLPQHPLCQVELFGGAGVQVGGRRISERAWKKSKARLLFLMLVLANGKEIPRDQILDYLWPDMDEHRARNNFYVVWSAMKLALTPGADKGTPCVYTDNSRGVCKLATRLVQSDIARFEGLVARLNSTSSSVEKLSLCEELAGIYLGELLPGDIYEDWFSSARDKYRVQFADAMLLASGLLHQRGEIPRALIMARRGLEEDPLREDLGQAALQLQIASGQRSAAIETFMNIKRRLCDELGIDPSAETVRLYERVLAMEEMGEYLTDEESAGEPESAP